MATHGLYRKAKKEVDAEYDQLIKQGFRPERNSDGETYSWVNDKNQIYTGKLNPTGGIDAEAGFMKRHLTREARQNRIMSEKVSALLPKDRPASEVKKKDDDTTPPPPSPGTGGGPVDGGPGQGYTLPSTAGLVPAETIDPDQYPLLPAEPLEELPSEGVPQLEPIPNWRQAIPYDVGGKDDPYIYVEESKWQAEKSPWERLWNNKYGGTGAAEVDAVKKGTTLSPRIYSGEWKRKVTKDGKTYTLVMNPDYAHPKQRVDVMMAETIQGGLLPRSVGQLPGQAIAQGQAIRAGAAGKKAATASKTAMESAAVARDKGSAISKWHAAKDSKLAKSLAEKARQIAKRARTWDRVAQAQKQGSTVAGTSKVGTAAKSAATSVPSATTAPPAAPAAQNFHGAGMLKTAPGKPTQLGGYPNYTAPSTQPSYSQGSLWDIPQGPRQSIVTPNIPRPVNIPKGLSNQMLPFRDNMGKYYPVRKKLGGKLAPRAGKG